MKTLQVALPDALARQVDQVVRDGWFASEDEVIREALRQLVGRRRFDLMQQHQLADIKWAESKARVRP